ncbi:MAG: tRNA-dihydrouridine synthase [Candidatus Aminicenantes bacterium]|nr:tRNA-dihydrouridine synthase [Candidatus Aminicenantes bacterium]
MTLQIGSLSLASPYVLAPMASLTDVAFRCLVSEMGGVGLLITEMISAEGLLRRNQRTMEMIRNSNDTTPVFIQLFGENPDAMAEAARMVAAETGFDGIDINMGCPAGKVIRKGAGAALMKDPAKAAKIVAAARHAAPDLPLTVKMRLGFDRVNAPVFLEAIQAEGVDAVIVHFRLQCHRYRVPADWSHAGSLRHIARVPLVGNGDVMTEADARMRLAQVDGVMIGRGAIMDPLIFHRLAGGNGSVDLEERVIPRLLELIETHYPEPMRLGRLKALTRFLVSGRHMSRRYRQAIYTATTYAQGARNLLALADRLINGHGAAQT